MRMENLAPAGNWESLERAVAAGADAVYLGYAAYSARAGAGNFDRRQLADAIAFCHLHHVRVHVTVNTLVKDSELEGVEDVLRMLRGLGADAVLIQDLGVLRTALKCVPGLAVHASTQMAIHNASGAAWCRSVGMKRVVLARECSLDEIRKAAGTGIEVEVFGHGAQCVSVSGECLFSSMVGDRSGNRGRCAQPCRRDYLLRGQRGAWLSPRDVCLRDRLDEVAGAGAVSVKLEGRLKRPEYVAVVADSYRRGLDGVADGCFHPADSAEKTQLLQMFQRGGFMDGYAFGAEDAGVIAPERVNHGGVLIGTVEEVSGRLAKIRLAAPLHDGDQLRLEGGHPDYEMLYAGKETPPGGIATLRLREDARVRRGDRVVRLTDSALMRWAQELPQRTIRVTMIFRAMPGEPLALTVSDGTSVVTVTGGIAAEAQKRALTEEDAVRSLGKTGDTAFTAGEIRVTTARAFVPVSELNRLRREALEQLANARRDAFAPEPGASFPQDELILPAGKLPTTVLFRAISQIADVPPDARLVWSPEDWRETPLEEGLAALPDGVWLQLPTVSEEQTLQDLRAFVLSHRDRLGGVMLGSVGQLGLDWRLPIGAGSGIPVMNRRAAQFLFEQGCAFVTASPELTGGELRVLLDGDPPILVPAWGRQQLMLLHHCPARTLLGLREGHSSCALCDRNSPDSLRGLTLDDPRGYSYPLQRVRLPEGCLVRLLNERPTDIRREVARAGWPMLIELTDEDGFSGLDGRETTSGHWKRPIE